MNGHVKMCGVIEGRDSANHHLRMYLFDKVGNLLHKSDKDDDYTPSLTNNYQKMVEIAEKLSKDFTFVRVDLRDLRRKIIFGELTFTPTGGFNNYI